MYDIVSIKKVKGVVVYYAQSDSEEDEILTHLSYPAKNSPADASFIAKAGKFFDLKYSVHAVIQCPEHNVITLTIIPSSKNAVSYRSYLRDVFSPPPNAFQS